MAFLKPVNEAAREAVRQRILSGLWRVDAPDGVVYGVQGQIMRGARNTSGYVQYRFNLAGKTMGASGHIVIWEHVHGPVPTGMQVNHKNGVKDDNRIENLELLTPVENLRHAHRTGLMPYRRGPDAPGATLTADQVRYIREQRTLGRTNTDVARELGVPQCTVSHVGLGRIYASVA